VTLKDGAVAKGGRFYSVVNAPDPRIDRTGKTPEQYEKAIEAAVAAAWRSRRRRT
jgi:hypothetical protein